MFIVETLNVLLPAQQELFSLQPCNNFACSNFAVLCNWRSITSNKQLVALLNVALRFLKSDQCTEFDVMAFVMHIDDEYTRDSKLITPASLGATLLVVT